MVFLYLYIICSALSKIETLEISPVYLILLLKTQWSYCLSYFSNQSTSLPQQVISALGVSRKKWGAVGERSTAADSG